MRLVSLPDNLKIRPYLTIGKEYAFEPWGYNGARIQADNGEYTIILRERLQ